MKTTIDLPDDLMRQIKIRAVREDRRLKDLMEELLRKGMAEDESGTPVKRRVQFPLIETAHPAPPGEEMTPERIKGILLQQEVDWAIK